jgi:iduronate 2-sulfatase
MNPTKRILTFICMIFVLSSTAYAQKPNVLFIAVDDLKPMLNCYGYDFAETPNFDRLADAGAYFTRAYCQEALCGPTRISIMTGRYPDVVGIYGMGGPETKLRKRHPDIVTLPQYFKQNGYHTATMGKIYDGRNFEGNNDPASWTEIGKQGQYPAPWGAPMRGYQNPGTKARAKKAWDEVESLGASTNLSVRNPILKKANARPVVERMDVPDNAYNDGQTALWGQEQLQKYAGDKNGEPFFLALGFSKPHLPFVAPAKYWDMYDRDSLPLPAYKKDPAGLPPMSHNDYVEGRVYNGVPDEGEIPDDKHRELLHGYLACISYIDAQVGLLLNTLKETGLNKNTIVILWGDHGFHTADHGIWGKHSNWEEATRVPFLISAPWLKPVGESDSFVEFVDIYPTLCDLAGLPVPSTLDGKSLTPLMKNPRATVRDFASSLYPRWGSKHLGFTIRTDRYRYIAWYKSRQEKQGGYFIEGMPEGLELYDYQEDPDETENLVGKPEYRDIESELMKQLQSHIEYTQDNKL